MHAIPAVSESASFDARTSPHTPAQIGKATRAKRAHNQLTPLQRLKTCDKTALGVAARPAVPITATTAAANILAGAASGCLSARLRRCRSQGQARLHLRQRAPTRRGEGGR
eukprot:2378570-Prymnesium_polylepis.1